MKVTDRKKKDSKSRNTCDLYYTLQIQQMIEQNSTEQTALKSLYILPCTILKKLQFYDKVTKK